MKNFLYRKQSLILIKKYQKLESENYIDILTREFQKELLRTKEVQSEILTRGIEEEDALKTLESEIPKFINANADLLLQSQELMQKKRICLEEFFLDNEVRKEFCELSKNLEKCVEYKEIDSLENDVEYTEYMNSLFNAWDFFYLSQMKLINIYQMSKKPLKDSDTQTT